MSSNVELMVLTKFKFVPLSGMPHLILTEENRSFGQVLTHSKEVFIKKEKLLTTPLSKEQNLILTLCNQNNFIELDEISGGWVRLEKFFENLSINNPQRYVALMLKMNMLYWSETAEKIAWQNPEKSLSQIMDPKIIPVIDRNNNSIAEQTNNILFLRYIHTNKIFQKEYKEKIKYIQDERKSIIESDIDDIYNIFRAENSDCFIKLERQFKEEFDRTMLRIESSRKQMEEDIDDS